MIALVEPAGPALEAPAEVSASPAVPGGARSGVPASKGLRRPRLTLALDGIWSKRLGLVTAPPGSGKTTLLAGWARRCGAPVAWYSSEPGHTSAQDLLEQIYRAAAEPFGVEGPWTSVDRAIDALGARPATPGLLVVDDLHVIAGTPAEATLAQLIARLPPNLKMLGATRRAPALNLSRLRVEDALLELTSDDLRFRTWEAESLFREHYGRTMLPEEVSTLTHKTEGWAAGLQLFHLATRDRSPSECARMLANFSAHSRLVAEYLADNVIAALPADMVDFMVLTCPLGVLTAPACDALSDRLDSSRMLREMEARQLFVTSPDGGLTYRYHEILRSHLDGRLVARLGEARAREWHYRAGLLLLAGGFPEAALRALCRAEAWEKARSVLAKLSKGGPGTTDASVGCSAALDAIPQHLLESDPWVGLARARCHVASGHLAAAVAAYRACEQGLPRLAADACRVEMVAVAAWTSPMTTPAPGWTNVLRRAVAREPLQALTELPGLDRYHASRRPPGAVLDQSRASQDEPEMEEGVELALSGLAALLAGRVKQASATLQQASMRVTSPVLGLSVRIAATLATMIGARSGADLQDCARRALAMAGEAERLGSAWLSRQAYALLALAGRPEVAAQVSAQCENESDAWGAVLAQLLEGAGRLAMGQAPVEPLTRAAANSRLLGAGVLEAWALGCLALAEARAKNPQARELALGAEATARRAGVPGAQALAHLALGHSGPRAPEHLRLGRSMGNDCGLGIFRSPHRHSGRPTPEPVPSRVTHPGVAQPGVAQPGAAQVGAAQPLWAGAGGLRVQCLGGLSASLKGQSIDLDLLRPRARALLALLALNHPLPVHCEVLLEALWPGTEPRAGARNLQTAISSLRRELGKASEAAGLDQHPGTGHAFLVRRGEAYLLQAESIDVARLELSFRTARAARNSRDVATEVEALQEVLSTHRAELLPEFGPADWAVKERDRLHWDTIDCAERLAELELAAGRPAGALTAARAGLALDQYRESLWRLAIRAAEASGDHGLASTLSLGRTSALAELGIPDPR